MNQFLAYYGPLIQHVSVLALLGYSVQIATRAGVFSFATVGVYALGGYWSANLLKDAHLPLPAVVVFTVVGGAGISAIVSGIVTRLKALYLAMATLALTLFVQAIVQVWGRYTGGAQGLYLIPRVLPQGGVIACVLIVALLVWVTQRGSWGRAITTIRHDELLARAVGIRVTRYQAVAFVASGAVAALAGLVQSSTVGVFGPADIGFDEVVVSLTVMVVGGSLSSAGPLLGAVLIGSLPTWLAMSGDWTLIIQSLILLVVVVLLPGGLTGLLAAGWSWSRSLVSGRSATPSMEEVSHGTPRA